MNVMLIILFLFYGSVEYASSIQCYTCIETGFYCSLPLNLDAGDESNEDSVASFGYDSDHACVSNHSLNVKTGEEKLMLRGVKNCQELNVPNHRIHCCHTNNCNKQIPTMTVKTLADFTDIKTASKSNNQNSLSSLKVILLAIIFQYFLFK